MRPASLWLLACAPAFARLGGAPEPEPPPSIVRIALPSESDERQPLVLPTEPENTIEVDFPGPWRTGRAAGSPRTPRGLPGTS